MAIEILNDIVLCGIRMPSLVSYMIESANIPVYNCTMASKKKRNKKYQGIDASETPSVIKVKAPERSKFGEWFHENKQTVFIRIAQIGAILIIGSAIYLIFW